MEDDESKAQLKEMSQFLVNAAMLASGYELKNYQEFIQKVYLKERLALGIDEDLNELDVDISNIELEDWEKSSKENVMQNPEVNDAIYDWIDQ